MSNDDYKLRVTNALLNYHKKDLREIDKLQGKNKRGRPRKNRPEKTVENECVKWMKSMGWIGQVYESKAVWNSKAQMYMANPGLRVGNADWQGMIPLPLGIPAVVEFKAKGKLSTYAEERNGAQQMFIEERLKAGAFAVVVDSAERLSYLFFRWQSIREVDGVYAAQDFLFGTLPGNKKAT